MMKRRPAFKEPHPPTKSRLASEWRHALPHLELVSVLVAVMLGWSALQATYPVLQMPDELKAVTPQRGPAEKVQQKEKFQQKANLYNPIIALGMVGAAIGVSLAVGRGLIARSMPRVVVSAFLGLVAGAGFGCLGGWVGHLVVSQMPKVNVPLSSQIMLHVAVMATMATGIGWAIGIPGGTLRSALGGLLAGAAAGVLAGMAYPILAAVFVPTASMESIVPDHTPERLLWLLLAAGALAVTLSAGKPKARAAVST